MKRVILLLFPLLLSQFISAQTDSLNTISKPINSDYFNLEEEEKFFLHTNKTTYFTGERVWWKAYVVQDINEKPSTNTSNLYVNFYNPEKKLISHQLFFCDNGTSNGEIDLPEDLKSGTYYIALDTQWNRNYNNPYTTSIQVINTKTNNSQTQESIASVNEDSKNITVEFYPESGALLENIKNTVYFNIKNNGKYTPNQTVKIINTTIQKQKLQTKTNAYGHGQFDFVYNSKNNYSLEFNYNNKDYRFTLNTNTDSGIVIHKEIKATESSQEKFVIKFSEEVVKKHHGEKLYTIVHRNQKPIYIKAFEIDKQYLNYGLPIEKRELFNGVNTLTIFNTKNQPLA
ncbi:hypothetical protein [Formosa sp. A9]|uniref:hypothetical protein n=1 Tax=Formosa sp. A9 TaxID=3442641 RepID=UPI003EBBA051